MALMSQRRIAQGSIGLIVAALLLCATGCGQIIEEIANEAGGTSTEAETKAPKGDFLQEQSAEAAPPAGEIVEPAVVGQNLPAPEPAQNPVASPAGQSNVPPIRLSVGVALPQTLPSGTGMSFSVDYQFREGGPNQSNKYVWVIKRGDGQSIGQPVQLKAKGNLTSIVPRLRPSAGPFTSQILEVAPDGSQRKISNSIGMR